ncbi:MAG TPA: hypothetical protein VMM18_06625 [Gemmatimonadaceae bacterium]|nr:hypothetical protein [Gemmatimonadaceae bacterium]
MVALALCASLGGLAPSVGAQLAVDRVDLTLVPRSATERAGTITVTNTSDRPVAATVYTADWDRDLDGANRFYELGTLPRSCGSVLRVFPRTISLPPSSAQTLQVIVDGADAFVATCWAIVFIETRLPPPPGESRQLSYVLRTGVKAYVVPPGLSADGVVEDMRLHAGHAEATVAAPQPPASRRLEVVFRNAGAIPLVTRGRVEIRRPDNTVAATIPVEEFPTLPGVRRRLILDVPVLAPGRYVALALLDFGGAEIVAGQLEFEAP